MSVRLKILIPILIILFPVVFWLVLTTGKNAFRTLPVFGPIHVGEKGDTLFHEVKDFTFINQKGDSIRYSDLDGKIVVAGFFSIQCADSCIKLMEEMRRLQFLFEDDSLVRFLSFSLDPDRDSIPALDAYATSLKANADRWWLIYGNRDSILNLCRESFLIHPEINDDIENLQAPDQLILIDSKRRIRGYYDGMEKADVDTLRDEIKILLFEKRRLGQQQVS